MYTDFNNFFTVRTVNLWRIKRTLRLPPHLYSVIALLSKTYTSANIDAQIWLIDVNGPLATTKVTVMRLINNIPARLQVQYVLVFYEGLLWLQGASSCLHIMSWIIETLSAVLRDLGRPLPDFRSADPQLSIFLVILATDHLLLGNSFYYAFGPHFLTVRRPFIKQRSSFVIPPI